MFSFFTVGRILIGRASFSNQKQLGYPRGEGRRLATKGTKSTKGRSRSVVLPFVLFVPFVANLLPSPLLTGAAAIGRTAMLYSRPKETPMLRLIVLSTVSAFVLLLVISPGGAHHAPSAIFDMGKRIS